MASPAGVSRMTTSMRYGSMLGTPSSIGTSRCRCVANTPLHSNNTGADGNCRNRACDDVEGLAQAVQARSKARKEDRRPCNTYASVVIDGGTVTDNA